MSRDRHDLTARQLQVFGSNCVLGPMFPKRRNYEIDNVAERA